MLRYAVLFMPLLYSTSLKGYAYHFYCNCYLLHTGSDFLKMYFLKNIVQVRGGIALNYFNSYNDRKLDDDKDNPYSEF